VSGTGTSNFTGALQQAGNNVCTTAGNCVGGGSAGSAIGGSGTANTLALFTSSGNIGNSILTQASGTITVGGNLQVSGDFTSGNQSIHSLTRTLPNAVNDEVDVGSFSVNAGGRTLDISVVVSDSGFSVAKDYIVPVQYGNTGWLTVLPNNDTGAYGPNDFALDVNVSASTMQLRLRRTSGSTNGVAHVTITKKGSSADTFTSSSATSSVAAPTGYYQANALTQINGNVGIGTSAPAYKLDVTGGARFTGTVTGADATASNQFATLGQVNSAIGGGSGNGNYIINGTSLQSGANFNISGNGTIGGVASASTLSVASGASVGGSLAVSGNIITVGQVISSRLGFAGTYNSAQVQGIWSIGTSYEINTTSNNYGNLFGLGYTYNPGSGQGIAGLNHQIDFVGNGTTNAAISIQTGAAYFGGAVSIGTTSPGTYKLNVNGNTNATKVYQNGNQ
ncbi:MAG: hypothetical protein ACREHG_00615, partial [Candidatus Saccharimonadales bacterium]